MGNYQRGGNRGGNRGGRSFGGRRDGGRGDRQMHDAVCDSCGKNCQVPFRPTSGKPVYCSDCFEKNSGGSNRQDRGFSRPQREGRRTNPLFDEMNKKLDRIIELLEKTSKKEIKEEKVEVKEKKAKKATKAKTSKTKKETASKEK